MNVACSGRDPDRHHQLPQLRARRSARPATGSWPRRWPGWPRRAAALGLPIVSGNVSLYNETPDGPILPTPVVGTVGLLEDRSRAVPMRVARRRRDLAARRSRPGTPRRSRPRSWPGGAAGSAGDPALDLAAAARLVSLLGDLGERRAAGAERTTLSVGGLGVALARLAIASGMGADHHAAGGGAVGCRPPPLRRARRAGCWSPSRPRSAAAVAAAPSAAGVPAAAAWRRRAAISAGGRASARSRLTLSLDQLPRRLDARPSSAGGASPRLVGAAGASAGRPLRRARGLSLPVPAAAGAASAPSAGGERGSSCCSPPRARSWRCVDLLQAVRRHAIGEELAEDVDDLRVELGAGVGAQLGAGHARGRGRCCTAGRGSWRGRRRRRRRSGHRAGSPCRAARADSRCR